MTLLFFLIAAACLSSATPFTIGLRTNDPRNSKSNYRISPVDGSKIALPTKEQLAFQDKEIGVLIHLDVATYLNLDGCNGDPTLVPDINLFDPSSLNTDQWIESIADLTGKFATLVAKHNCGFATWPSKVTFQTRDDKTVAYNYTIAQSPVAGTDLVKNLVDSAESRGIGHGLYYSVIWNNYLNVEGSHVRPEALSPGQVGITNDTYNQIVFDQLTKLWSNYGNLTEIWFDGGYSEALGDQIEKLLDAHQPQAAIFQGCAANGTCVSANSFRWVGTEAGEAPENTWSSGLSGGGDSESPIFCPAVCDTTLQTDGLWFYHDDQPVRSLEEMIDVYHATVGRNCILELGITPKGSGLLPDSQVARSKELGNFISSCYGNPIRKVTNATDGCGAHFMNFEPPTSIDRIVLMEDQTNGQVVRSYQVHAKIVDGQTAVANLPWILVSNGTSIGHKKIDIFGKAINVAEVKVNSTHVDTPRWRSVSAYHCSGLTNGAYPATS